MHWRAQADQAQARENRLVNLRLLASATFVAVAIWVYAFAGIPWLLLVPGAGFILLVALHTQAKTSKRRAANGLSYIEHAQARLINAWIGRGPDRDYSDEHHPYACDLDLFGRGSLFDLLCTAATQGGQQKLADWLMQPASCETINDRQQAVQWLKPRAELRELMALRAAENRSHMSGDALARWGAQAAPALCANTLATFVAWGLSFGFVLAVVLWNFTSLGPTPLLIQALLAWVAHYFYRKEIKTSLAGLDSAEKELALVATLLQQVELELSAAPGNRLLESLAANLNTSAQAQTASTAIARLKTKLSWLEARSNQLVAPVAYLLGWSLHWGRSIDRWRQQHGPLLASWLDTLAVFEALNALANFAFDHPDYCQPKLIPGSTAVFNGRELGHPLLPAQERINNDVNFPKPLQVMLVSGSNMSGKSTLMRTLGINTVLALAGGVVCAHRLELSPLQIGATLRIQDSLHDGQSRFYAEILRLKQIVDLSNADTPLLFLLDEVLSGTNSHDRQIGARQIIQGLVATGAIGMVTTHDLALAQAADALAPKACNLHFRDEMVNGEIQFDYRLHPGVVEHSNALELMRSIGLAVD